MNNTIDCSTFKTATKSVTEILNVNELKLISFLNSIAQPPGNEEPSEHIYNMVCKQFKAPDPRGSYFRPGRHGA